jgi:glutamate formiminotransferase / 5-formyltetrahydrofolate cyclo-ligase
MLLLSVPNVSEGSDRSAIEAIGGAFAPARILDVHSDPDHGRSVFTLAAHQGELAGALAAGTRAAIERIDLRASRGVHPRVGAVDVAPVVYLDEERHGGAVAEALTAAALIGDEAGVPVFLYGELATAPEQRERADLRRGGPERLAERVAADELVPDYGPPRVNPRSGAVLVTARAPLVAFNLDLETDDGDVARAIAADLRESGGGPPGVRAIGLRLESPRRAQVSFNVHDHRAAPLGELVEAVSRRAPIAQAEIVGLAPAEALATLPAGLPVLGGERTIEDALRSLT